jgi:hypothetical protein
MQLTLRAIGVWVLVIVAEVLHGIARTLLLSPLVGDFRARQIAVFTGSIIILALAVTFIRWIRPSDVREAVYVGVLWLVLTLTFEIAFGRLVVGASWDRIASDYDLLRGGLLPIGLLVLTAAPLLAAKWRGVVVAGEGCPGLRWRRRRPRAPA